MNRYFTLLKSPELQAHYQMKFTVIPPTPFLGEEGFHSVSDAVNVF